MDMIDTSEKDHYYNRHFYFFVYVYICARVHRCPERSESTGSSGTEEEKVPESCELSDMGAGNKSPVVEEHPALLLSYLPSPSPNNL